MPRRPRRLRAAAEPVLRGGRAACSDLPRGEPRSRRARRDRPGGVRRRRGRGGALDAQRARGGLARRSCSRCGRRAQRDGVELFHASPRDPVWEYVLSADVARAALELTESPLVLVGHSHVPLAITLEDDVLDGGLAAGGTTTPLGPGRRLLNPGSVGQPRDGDPRAAWLLLDFEAGTRLVPPGRVRRRAHAGGDPREGAARCAGATACSRRLARCCWRVAAAAHAGVAAAAARRASRRTSPSRLAARGRPGRGAHARARARPATRPCASATT